MFTHRIHSLSTILLKRLPVAYWEYLFGSGSCLTRRCKVCESRQTTVVWSPVYFQSTPFWCKKLRFYVSSSWILSPFLFPEYPNSLRSSLLWEVCIASSPSVQFPFGFNRKPATKHNCFPYYRICAKRILSFLRGVSYQMSYYRTKHIGDTSHTPPMVRSNPFPSSHTSPSVFYPNPRMGKKTGPRDFHFCRLIKTTPMVRVKAMVAALTSGR